MPPVVGLLKFTAAVGALLHTTWLGTAVTVAVGLTRTVAVIGAPGQPLAVGVMVKVTVIGELVVLVNVPLIELPDPLAGIPVTVATLSLVQLYVVPATPDPLQFRPGTEKEPVFAQAGPLAARIHPEAMVEALQLIVKAP